MKTNNRTEVGDGSTRGRFDCPTNWKTHNQYQPKSSSVCSTTKIWNSVSGIHARGWTRDSSSLRYSRLSSCVFLYPPGFSHGVGEADSMGPDSSRSSTASYLHVSVSISAGATSSKRSLRRLFLQSDSAIGSRGRGWRGQLMRASTSSTTWASVGRDTGGWG